MTGQKTKLTSPCRPRTAVAALALALAFGIGCRTTTDNIHKWETTAQGPRKLVAVLTHEKYPTDLRVEAALTLVRMKPRSGRRVGIQGNDEQPGLIGALSQMAPANRNAIVARLVPALHSEIVRPLRVAAAGQPPSADPSIPYKDAAFALLVQEGGTLLSSERHRQQLRSALATWATTNFAERMDDSSQMFGMEQVLRELKTDGVRRLADLIVPGGSKIDRISDLIAELGDAETKARASRNLVVVAQKTSSEDWIRERAPAVDQANKQSKLNPSKTQFRAQLEQYQEEELLRVFGSMKRVGGAPAVNFLLTFAQDKSRSEKKRAASLAAVQGNLDRSNPAHADALLTVASAGDTPDSVRGQALTRVGELPRQLVVERLYQLFKDDNWNVRWVAGELVLKMSDTSQLPEFFDHIGKDAAGMSMSEPLGYGARITEMKGAKPPVEVVQAYLDKKSPVPARLTALGFYYHAGKPADLARLSSFADDKDKTPECKENAKECEWKCEIAAGDKRETKEIKTVAEFYEFCVKPAIESRQTAKAGP